MKNIEAIKNISIDVYNFIKNNCMKTIEIGRHQITEDIYANVEIYNTKDITEGKFESHKKYIDIQYIIDGEENIICENIDSLAIKEKYDENKDIIFYENNGLGISNILRNDEFIILYPKDAHMPCISIKESKTNKKIVFKIPIGGE